MKLPDKNFDNQNSTVELMHFGYRILSWIIIVNILIAVLVVWSMAFIILRQYQNYDLIQVWDFRILLVGFHSIFLTLSLIGWHMQLTWHRLGDMMLYPYAMVIGTLMLNAAAVKLVMIVLSTQVYD